MRNAARALVTRNSDAKNGNMPRNESIGTKHSYAIIKIRRQILFLFVHFWFLTKNVFGWILIIYFRGERFNTTHTVFYPYPVQYSRGNQKLAPTLPRVPQKKTLLCTSLPPLCFCLFSGVFFRRNRRATTAFCFFLL